MATTADTTELAERLTTIAQLLTSTSIDPAERGSYLQLARQVEDLRHDLDTHVKELIHQARTHDGATWEHIAHHFGLNHRQAAQRKWGKT